MLSRALSEKFRFWTLASVLLLVLVHSYNLAVRYVQPWSVPEDAFNVTSGIEYFLADGLLRFFIPLLFAISGYLHALHDRRPYLERIGKRVRTLVLPYLAWVALHLLSFYLLESLPATRELIFDSHVAQVDAARVIVHQYNWYDLLAGSVLYPLPYQFWFLRVLFVYNVGYPLLMWLVTSPRARWVFFAVAIYLWLGTRWFVLVEGEGLLFFSLGILLQKSRFDLERPARWLQPACWGALSVAAAAVKTLLAFKGAALAGDQLPVLITALHKLAVISGLIGAWFGLDRVVGWAMAQRWWVWLCAFPFIIYVVHAPLIAVLIDPLLRLSAGVPGHQLLLFFVLPVLMVAFAVCIGAVLRYAAPAVFSLLSGGRGVAGARGDGDKNASPPLSIIREGGL